MQRLPRAVALASLVVFACHGDGGPESPSSGDGDTSSAASAITRPPLSVPANTILADATGVLAPKGDGTMSVDDRGQAHQHIPIWVPPGRAGIQPDLSLDYASGAGNGLVGASWGLAGLSRISRCPGMRKNGQIAKPIQWNEGDSFCLDGETLVPDSDHYFYTKFHDDGTRVVRIRNAITDAGYWKLVTKDGHILTFGNTLDSRVTVSRYLAAPVVMTFALSRTEDRAGNFMLVKYGPDNGVVGADIEPVEIDYTGSGGDPTTAKRSVTFTYDHTRTDVDQKIVAEQIFAYHDRLKSIAMHAPNSANLDPLRTVSFAYTNSAVTGHSLLRNLAECDGPAPATLPVSGSTPLCRQQTFNYAPGVPLGASNAYNVAATDSSGALIGDVSPLGVEGVPANVRLLDVDGDGRDDLLYLSNDAGETYHLRLFDPVKAAFGPAIVTGVTASIPIHLTNPGGATSAPVVLDFNGDGHSDVLVNVGSTDSPIAMIYLANNAGGTWTLGGNSYQYQFQLWGLTAPPMRSPLDPPFRAFQSADLNGDGRPDLIMNRDGNAYYSLNIDGTAFGLSTPAMLPGQTDTNYVDAPTSYFLDFNNDGVTDIMTRRWRDTACKGYKTGDYFCNCDKIGFGAVDLQSNLYAGYNNASGSTSSWVGLDYCTNSDVDDLDVYGHLFGDYNGDGSVDALQLYTPRDPMNPNPDMTVTMMLGGGDQGFNKQVGAPAVLTLPNPLSYAMDVFDADGDGRADLLLRGYGALPYSVRSWKNGAWQPATPLIIGEDQLTGPQNDLMADGDVDGDGLSDFVAYTGNDSISLYMRNSAGPRADLLTSTSGDFVSSAAVKYQPYHIKPDEDRSDCRPPLSCVTRAGFVVSELDVDNGIGGMNAETHSFAGARSDATGWGFLGFKSHTITDVPTQAITTRTFDFYLYTAGATPFYPQIGLPSLVRTTVNYQSGTQTVTRTSTTGTSYTVQGTGPFMAVPTVVESEVHDSNASGSLSSHNIQRAFDPYGNVTQETDFDPIADESRTTTTTYHNDYGMMIYGLPTYTSTTSTVNVSSGGTSQTRATGYTYDALGQLAVQVDNPGAANGTSWDPLTSQSDGVQTLYMRYTRDGNGQVHIVEKLDNLTSPNFRRAAQYDYDASEGMFVVQTTDGAGLVTQAAYEPGLGVIAAQTDAAGLLTTFQYDTFGRIRADHPPAGGGRIVAYKAGNTVEDHRSGQYLTVSTLDSLRRTVQTKTTGRLDGKAVYVNTVYDLFGRVASVSRPHFSGVTAAKTTTSYDNLGRVTRIQGADGSVQTTSYLGLAATTTNPDGNVSTVTNDTHGRPVTSVQTIAPGHTTTTTLAYGPFDTLTSSTDTLGNVVSSNYDRLGRLRWKNDLDSHATAHFYNVFGEVSDEIRGAHLQPVVFGGHLNWLIMGGTDTQATYDGDGRITSKTTPDMTQVFTYDNVMPGKLSNATITGGPTIAYTYITSGNGVGNVGTKTWAGPRGAIGYTYTYDAYNRLKTTTYPKLSNGAKSLVVRNTYSGGDIGGELTKVDDITSSTTTVNYWTLGSTDASEQFPTATLVNNVTQTLGEDPAHPGWLSTIVSKQGTSSTVQNLAYLREGGGRVHERDDLAAQPTKVIELFYYDGVERLTNWTWSGAAGARGVSYVYDDIGNLTARNVTAGPGTSVTYTIGGPPIGPHQVASDGTTTYSYDAEGKELVGPGRTFAWNTLGRPTSVTASTGTYTMVYDADLARFSRTDPSGHTRYSYGGNFEEFTDAAGTHDVLTIAANGVPVGEKEITKNAASTAKTNTLLTDALGSIDTIVTSSGRQSIKYDPFGTRVTAADPTVRITTAPQDLRAGFTGHDHDDDTNLIDMIGRVYDPVQQRFLSVDPPAPDPVDGQAYNPYAYVRNNPLNATDPTGYLTINGSSLGLSPNAGCMQNSTDTTLAWVTETTYIIPYGTLPGESQGASGQAGPAMVESSKSGTAEHSGASKINPVEFAQYTEVEGERSESGEKKPGSVVVKLNDGFFGIKLMANGSDWSFRLNLGFFTPGFSIGVKNEEPDETDAGLIVDTELKLGAGPLAIGYEGEIEGFAGGKSFELQGIGPLTSSGVKVMANGDWKPVGEAKLSGEWSKLMSHEWELGLETGGGAGLSLTYRSGGFERGWNYVQQSFRNFGRAITDPRVQEMFHWTSTLSGTDANPRHE